VVYFRKSKGREATFKNLRKRMERPFEREWATGVGEGGVDGQRRNQRLLMTLVRRTIEIRGKKGRDIHLLYIPGDDCQPAE